MRQDWEYRGLVGMNSVRPELHDAQQLTRDKLRIHNSSSSQHQHLHLQQDFPNNLEQYLSLPPAFNLDLLQVRDNNNVRKANILDEAPLYSSEMIPPHQYGSLPPSSSTIFHSSPKQQCGNWMVNYASTSSEANQSNNPNSILPFELNNNMSTHQQHYDQKPSCTNIVVTDLQCSSPSLYQNALQDIFKSSSITAHTSEMASLQVNHGIWGGNASAPVLINHPSYEHQANFWTNGTVVDNNTPRWNIFSDKRINEQQHTGNVLSDSDNPQGLCLSLSSNSHPNPSSSRFEIDPQSRSGVSKHVKSLQEPIPMGIPSNTTHRNPGPLGPFTGYATILKSSRFLKPCQELLDQCCSRCQGLGVSTYDVDESWVAAKRGNSGALSSTMFYNSNENSADGGAESSFGLSSRPECQKNKAKLLYMQEEVTGRYKQYHQQMQLVVSSFESVAGLSSATPYISLALKSVSRHFRSLKIAISDQLKFVCEVLGEDSSIPTTRTTTSGKFDTNIARLRCMDQSFQKNKSGRSNMDIVESQQHIWRPQRGLPDRAVAILKAWLFEHFLHPYPTDTDKHMLASQTGLSRNQVSNWFINARVRVWKPMVEEIHNLETKGTTTTGGNHNTSKNEGTSCASEGSSSRKFEEKGLNDEQWNQEKRSKLMELDIPSGVDGTLMGFMPYPRGGGLGSVSLTLGLMHGVGGVQPHQQQLQQQQRRGHFGGHMIHDFDG